MLTKSNVLVSKYFVLSLSRTPVGCLVSKGISKQHS